MEEAASNMIASGRSFSPDDIIEWAGGNGLSSLQSFTGETIDLDKFRSAVQGYGVMAQALAGDTMFTRFDQLGDGASDYFGDFFGNMDTFSGVKPELMKGYLGEAMKGAIDEGFAAMAKLSDEKAAKTIVRMFAQEGAEDEFTNFDEFDRFMDSFKCSNCSNGDDFLQQAQGVLNQFRAMDNSSEMTYFG